ELIQAARREVQEETGFAPAVVEPIDFVYSFPVDPVWRPFYARDVTEIIETVFTAQVEDAEPRLSFEHDAWQWCQLDEALGMLKWPNNIEALQRCDVFLSNRQ
ncbi:MAG: NUDIX domain-containing protein, partial [Chloroflexi bacterium]|nr:NUDIX domain-containing protein [Chloroflexota bacterium]